MSGTRAFGERVPGENYQSRHVVAALVSDAAGRIAVMQVGDRYFLPGGGIEAGETELQALIREVREECACLVEIGERLGEAIYHQFAPAYGGWTIHSVYYRAIFGTSVGAPVERDHVLVYLPPHQAQEVLFRRSDAWAVGVAFAADSQP